MDFSISTEDLEIFQEVRLFIQKETTPELLKEAHGCEMIYGGPESRKFIKKFAANGWLTPTWPEEYGGMGASEMLTYMIREEMTYAGVPSFFAGAHFTGPTILRNASEEMKKKWLPPIARGEIEFAMGYSEPDAGSDMLSLKMKAEDKGDHWLVNGQKTFNTHAHVADYHWLAVRTDPDAPKHKGISLLIVDMKSPGISVQPMNTLIAKTNDVFYDNVKVPKENLVGEVNKGYQYLLGALNFERMFPFGHYRKCYESVVEFSRNTIVDGAPLSKSPTVRQKLADMAIDLEAARLLYYHLPYLLDSGKVPSYQTSMEKIFMSERVARKLTQSAMEIMGPYGQLDEHDKWAPSANLVNYYFRWGILETIYGGTSEIQRNIIAQRGLGLPRD